MGEMNNPKSDIPEDLKGEKKRMIFGNIEAIYEWHREYFFNLSSDFYFVYNIFHFCSYFVKALQRCIKTPSELGPMIKRYERKFHMYINYCRNKPVSEHIVSEHVMYFEQIRQKLKHRLDVSF